ncbi:MAG: NTP transferase domain-containing protein [Candidatus Aegiribacteria sp.]|nr:NTP transferase domain-containing protein [Candidatus Aegiribacteria sp.]
MKVLILAAGTGSRLGAGTPKILVEVSGKTILSRHVDSLTKAGIASEKVTVVTGYKFDDVTDSCRTLGLKTVYNPRWNTPGTFSSFFAIPPSDSSLLIIHGDLLWEAGLAMGTFNSSGDIAVPVDPRNRADEEAMKAEVRGSRLLRLSKSLPVSRSAGESMGMFFIRHHRILHRLSERLSDDPSANFDDAVNLAAGSLRTEAWITDQFVWEEVDTPEDLAAAGIKFS